MAQIANLTLSPIVVNVANATVTVDYDIQYSAGDVASRQPYAEVCQLIGDDTGVGDPVTAGADDTILNGLLSPFFSQVASDGVVTVQHRHFTKTVALQALNEDQGAIPNPDEIRAKVTLTPILPATTTRESNLQTLNIN
jgi:hypothetical protein